MEISNDTHQPESNPELIEVVYKTEVLEILKSIWRYRRLAWIILNSNLTPFKKKALLVGIDWYGSELASDTREICQVDYKAALFINNSGEASLYNLNLATLRQSLLECDLLEFETWCQLRKSKFRKSFIVGNSTLNGEGRAFLEKLLSDREDFYMNGSYITTGVYQKEGEIIIEQETLTNGGNKRGSSVRWKFAIDGSRKFMMIC